MTLRDSRAAFKLVVNGSRMLSDRPSAEMRGGEGWHNFPGACGGLPDGRVPWVILTGNLVG